MSIVSRAYRSGMNGIKAMLYRHAVMIITSTLLMGTLIVVLWPYSVHLIPAGHKGVLFKRLGSGTVLDHVYEEGLMITLPWNKLTIYDTRIQQKTTTLEVLTSDRLKSTMTLSFQFNVYPYNLPLLYKHVGADYFEKIVLPMIESSAREAVAKYGSADAFTKEIQQINQTISLDTSKIILDKISPDGINDVRLLTINDVQLVKFSFPSDVEAALQQKAIELARAETYQYKIMAEKLEAQRKTIEAEGIRDFQAIMGTGLTENYLRFRGIEATTQLASSPNSKIIMFGSNSTGGLPLVFDADRSDAAKPLTMANPSPPSMSLPKVAPLPSASTSGTGPGIVSQGPSGQSSVIPPPGSAGTQIPTASVGAGPKGPAAGPSQDGAPPRPK